MTATALRVWAQLRHDPRTVALIFVVPCALLALLWWVYDGAGVFQQVAPALLALFPLLVMFLVTSVATLRERSSGTLERLLTLPLSRPAFLGGYALAFGGLAVVQAVLATLLLVGPLGLETVGPWGLLVLVAVVDAVLGTALGLFVSAFARSEFQAVQFMPAVVLPQFLLCGLLVPRDDMPAVLEAVSRVLPLTYAVDATSKVASEPSPAIGGDLLVMVGFVVGLLALGALTLRRRTG